MNNMIVCEREVLGHMISAAAFRAGSDWTVMVLGGCAPHVGSVSLAEYKNGAVAVRSLLRDTHKDQVVGERFAVKISEQMRCTVSVCCGIHYDHPDHSDLQCIVCAADELLEELLAKIVRDI